MVRVQVLYFARAREATGSMTEESFEVGGAAADTDALRAALVAKHPSLQSVLESCVLAVNQEYATGNTALSGGAGGHHPPHQRRLIDGDRRDGTYQMEDEDDDGGHGRGRPERNTSTIPLTRRRYELLTPPDVPTRRTRP